MRYKIPINNNYYLDVKGNVYKHSLLMQPFVTPDGYVRIKLAIEPNVRKAFLVHRLMGLVFLNLDLNGPLVVNHINGIKNDNNLLNLEICTRGHNLKHAYDNGLIKIRKGENHPCAKLSQKQVNEIRCLLSNICTGEDIRNIAKMFNISRSNIYMIRSGHSW